MAVAALAGVTAAAVVVAKEMANAKQTVEAKAKTQQSTIKKQKNGSEDDGRSGLEAVSGGRQRGNGCGGGQGNGRGRQGGGVAGRRRRPQRQSLLQRLSSEVINDHRSTGESWRNTSPNNDGGGGGRGSRGGEKNRHTPSSYWRRTAILPDCTDSRGRVLNVVHCRRVGGGAHPSDDRKDDDESGGRGGTRHHRGDCNDVAGYHLRHISRGCDQDYDDDNNNAGHTTFFGPAGSWFCSSAAAAAATALLRRHSAADLCPPVANCKYLHFSISIYVRGLGRIFYLVFEWIQSGYINY
jgi:hypothetical protein